MVVATAVAGGSVLPVALKDLGSAVTIIQPQVVEHQYS